MTKVRGSIRCTICEADWKIGRGGGGGQKEKRTRGGLDGEIFDLERFGEVRHGVLTMFNAVWVIIYAIRASRLIVGGKG